jgi:hypothetical protein
MYLRIFPEFLLVCTSAHRTDVPAGNDLRRKEESRGEVSGAKPAAVFSFSQ